MFQCLIFIVTWLYLRINSYTLLKPNEKFYLNCLRYSPWKKKCRYYLSLQFSGEQLDVGQADDIEQPETSFEDSLGDRGAFDNELLEDDESLEDDNIESQADPDALEAYGIF